MQPMYKVPFELQLEALAPARGARSLLCTKILRVIAGKRRVYEAGLDGRKVIAKIYNSRLSGRWKLFTEWRGLTKLAQKGLNAPKPLFYGRTENGRWVIVAEYIEDSAPAVELFRNGESIRDKLEVIEPLFAGLAELNSAGVIQKDLHLGNFLLRQGKVFFLDAAKMKFLSGAAARPRSLQQLAILSWYIPKDLRNELPRLIRKYTDVRGWKITAEEEKLIEYYRKKHAEKEMKRQLKKSLRSSTRQVKLKEKNYTAVFDRDFYEGLGAAGDRPGLSEIDELAEKGRVLKNRNTSFLSQVAVKRREIVIKRYNHKGLFHSIRQSFKASRAKRSWLHGHRLRMLGVNTPKPLAFIEKRFGPLLWNSYILTEYVPGPNLDEFLTDENTSRRQKEDARQKIYDLMVTMHRSRITHGDFKRTNFIVSQGEVYVTDLDAVKVHRFRPFLIRRRLKDIRRLKQMFEQ